MKSAVFDCMVLLQAAVRDTGPAAQCFRKLEAGSVTLFVSPETLFELRDVLTRPKISRKFPVLTDEYVEAFLIKVQGAATELSDVAKVFSHPRDPKDEPYINLAIAADAHYIVSRDNDLLDLMRDATFSGRFPDLTVCTPEQFLTILKSLDAR